MLRFFSRFRFASFLTFFCVCFTPVILTYKTTTAKEDTIKRSCVSVCFFLFLPLLSPFLFLFSLSVLSFLPPLFVTYEYVSYCPSTSPPFLLLKRSPFFLLTMFFLFLIENTGIGCATDTQGSLTLIMMQQFAMSIGVFFFTPCQLPFLVEDPLSPPPPPPHSTPEEVDLHT